MSYNSKHIIAVLLNILEITMKNLTRWQEAAYNFALEILKDDDRQSELYFVRLINGVEASDDLGWNPGYDEYRHFDYKPYFEKDGYKNYKYEDDRTIKLLIESGFLDKQKTESYEVINHHADEMGYPKDLVPAGYRSVPNWEAIDNNRVNMKGLVIKAKTAHSSIVQEIIFNRSDFTLQPKFDKFLFMYKGNLLHTFRGQTRIYICFSTCFENKQFSVQTPYSEIQKKLSSKFQNKKPETLPQVGHKILKSMGSLLKIVNIKAKPFNFQIKYNKQGHGLVLYPKQI